MPEELIRRNREWSERISQQTPDYFKELAAIQAPDYFWIGCADSRVPANDIVKLPPGEIFVHRNIANVVVHSDLNCLSVIQFAVEVLKVKHIIVCGHYGCGGIYASMEDKHHGLIDNWLRHIKDVARFYEEELKALPENQRHNRLCELNVIEQVFNVCNTSTVIQHWKHDRELTVHGLIYAMNDGIIKDLDISISSLDQLDTFHRS